MDDFRFSRPTSSALHGKQTATVKTTVTDEFNDDLVKFARQRGYGSVSDFVRETLMATVYGPDWLIDLHRRRISGLFKNDASSAPVAGHQEPGAARGGLAELHRGLAE